jgi:F0F1-type ATP synthase membrane subunit a
VSPDASPRIDRVFADKAFSAERAADAVTSNNGREVNATQALYARWRKINGSRGNVRRGRLGLLAMTILIYIGVINLVCLYIFLYLAERAPIEGSEREAHSEERGAPLGSALPDPVNCP